ncbi:DUF342 domain-containing protein [Robertmurraya massiliosenegalensis]|uniref:DUF342 domain-containing protein n=1 Tax=Robertmurraya massiliosenegalensis TaxID=1287657 RepID=UPI0002D5ED0D|nr:FapA family protein [Robertmurraya massiliosenegalensis]
MDIPFRVSITKDQLTASIELKEPLAEGFSISANALKTFLEEQNVVFGINESLLFLMADNPSSLEYPITIAEGLPPQNGEDAYVILESDDKEKTKKKDKINFRDVLDIPSVKNGQVIAKVVPQTVGINGRGVTGKLLLARDGKQLKLKAGKNVMKEGNQFIATTDGQVSVTYKAITVNPVFEVNGDLDLKTGNVNFIGNVVIRGNVPTGYEVIAGGDIKVYGLVEGAQLVARGNIHISGGITAAHRGKVVAGGSVQTNYLNQADVRAGQDVIIHTSVLHSQVEAKESISCKNGPVIGGILRSGKDIHVKVLGNDLFTKTEIFVGFDPSIHKKEVKLKEELEEISENIKKLNLIENRLVEQAKIKGHASTKEQLLISKQRVTKRELQSKLKELEKQLEGIEVEKMNQGRYGVYVYDKVNPNTSLNFGKYVKLIRKTHTYVKFFLDHNEIKFEPI